VPSAEAEVIYHRRLEAITLRELVGSRSHEQLASANPFSALAWEATE
jgi:hypothetical protein